MNIEGWPDPHKMGLRSTGGSDPRQTAGGHAEPQRVDELFEALRAETMRDRPPGLRGVDEIRIVADHEIPGGLYVLVFGPGVMLPFLSYRVPPEFIAELVREQSNAMVRMRAGTPAASLVLPPGEQAPAFFKPRRMPPKG